MSRFEIIPIKWEYAQEKFASSEILNQGERLALQINVELQEPSQIRQIYLGAILNGRKYFVLANLCGEYEASMRALLAENLKLVGKDVELGRDAVLCCGDCELYDEEALGEALRIICVNLFARAS